MSLRSHGQPASAAALQHTQVTLYSVPNGVASTCATTGVKQLHWLNWPDECRPFPVIGHSYYVYGMAAPWPSLIQQPVVNV